MSRVLPLALAALLTGCTWLPRSGPFRSDMIAAGDEQHRAAVVAVDQAVINILSGVKQPTLLGTFGDARPPREQRIGVGDVLLITLWEAGSGGLFSSPVVDRTSPGSRTAVIPDQVVSRDGSITVPFAGRVDAAGLTPPDVERTIVTRLADKAIDPQALVTVTKNLSNTVTVIGQVGPGARVPLSVRGDRLLDVVASSGGVKAALSDISIVLARQGRILRVPMQAILEDPRENIYLQPDDVVTLVSDPLAYTSMGAVGRNGVIPFETTNLSLAEALAKTGGLADDRADPSALFIIRYETLPVARQLAQSIDVPTTAGAVPVIYNINMRDPLALLLAQRFPMRNKDILYVSNAPLTDLQKIFGLISLLVSPAVTGAGISNVAK